MSNFNRISSDGQRKHSCSRPLYYSLHEFALPAEINSFCDSCGAPTTLLYQSGVQKIAICPECVHWMDARCEGTNFEQADTRLKKALYRYQSEFLPKGITFFTTEENDPSDTRDVDAREADYESELNFFADCANHEARKAARLAYELSEAQDRIAALETENQALRKQLGGDA